MKRKKKTRRTSRQRSEEQISHPHHSRQKREKNRELIIRAILHEKCPHPRKSKNSVWGEGINGTKNTIQGKELILERGVGCLREDGKQNLGRK